VKPHILRSRKTGEVLSALKDKGFQIRGLLSVHLTNVMAEELFDIYRGVFLNYNDMIQQLIISPCLAVMVGCPSGGTVRSLREACGPQNPVLGKTLRPEAIRTLFGVDTVNNAVHCTDLPDDGESECRYFFETLAAL
jgi:nucleoside-diphosphate kinase